MRLEPRRLQRVGSVSACGLVILVLVACENPVEPIDDSAPDVRDWVTAEIATALDSDGHFLFASPSSSGDVPIVTGTDAGPFALAYLNTFAFPDEILGTSLGAQIQSQHGAPIDWAKLKALPRVLFVDSPYTDVPDSIPNYVRNHLGPYLMVHVTSRRQVIASVGVAAYATYLYVRSDGKIGLPSFGGGEFSSQGIHHGSPYRFPMEPEAAVVLVGQATGMRIASIPVLRRPSRLYAPQLAYWHLKTEAEVNCVGKDSGTTYVTDDIYVAPLGEFLVSLPESNPADSMRYSVRLGDGATQSHVVHFFVREGLSTQFEEVSFLRESQ